MVSKIMRKIAFFWRRATCSDIEWIRFLRKQGMVIGSDCRIIDRRIPAEAFLIRIGDHVTVTDGVQLLTHDGGIWLARREEPTINRFAPIDIGDNCFLGANSIVMPGVTIGPNSIVAAGAVVTRDVPANSIVGGVPARVLGDVSTYIERAREESIPLSQEETARILRGEDQTMVMKARLQQTYSWDHKSAPTERAPTSRKSQTDEVAG